MARLVLCVGAICSVAACGSIATTSSTAARRNRVAVPATTSHRHAVAIESGPLAVPPPSYPQLLPSATASTTGGFVPAETVRGQPAVWIDRQTSLVLLAFDQRLMGLRLHSGTVDAGATGWHFGPVIAPSERRQLAVAFNGGFKLDLGVGGFQSYGRVGSPVRNGLGSIVTYADGSTDIGSWHRGVPAPGRSVVSVRQNLPLLVDGGHPAADLGCLVCWGATLHGEIAPARSALGITGDGHLIWAGGETLTVQDLADALIGAKVMRAVELDINPEWVAAYIYAHRGAQGPLAPVPMVPGQPGVPGQFLSPYTRDFFTVVAH